MDDAIKRAPSGLKAPGRRFWKKVMAEYVLKDTHDLERLRQCCQCLDTIGAAEAVISEEGHFVFNRFEERREHPALKTQRDTTALFCRIIREMGLDIDTPDAPKPRPQY